jgi:hypothetical protein
MEPHLRLLKAGWKSVAEFGAFHCSAAVSHQSADIVVDRNRDAAAHQSPPAKVAHAEVIGRCFFDPALGQVRMAPIELQDEIQRRVDPSFFRNQFSFGYAGRRRSHAAAAVVTISLQAQCGLPDRTTFHRCHEIQHVAPGAASKTMEDAAQNLRLERAGAIAGNFNLQFPKLAFDLLATRPVARVPAVIPGGIVLLIAQMMGELDVHGSLQHSLHEPLQQSVFADDVFWLLIILQQLVD